MAASPEGVQSVRRLAAHHQHHLESLDRLQGVEHLRRNHDHLILAETVEQAADAYFGHPLEDMGRERRMAPCAR
jgi:hypothetical protein